MSPRVGALHAASATRQDTAAQEWPAGGVAKHAVSPLILLVLAAIALGLGVRWQRRRRRAGPPR